MKPSYTLRDGVFVIQNYNQAKPFASFLPGIAGEYGKPVWVFYANRGQCISSFGVRNRNGAMLEFYPANKAYAATSTFGFRTFIRLAGKKELYEPFQQTTDPAVRQEMHIRPGEVELIETHKTLGLRIQVVTFNLPNEPLPVLMRLVQIDNLGKRPLKFEILDGLPQIVPYGLNETLLKQMSRTMEAFAEVLCANTQLPLFKLKVEPSDRPDVQTIEGGFFSFTLRSDETQKVLIDPEGVFGQDTTFARPQPFAEGKKLGSGPQRTESFTPCAFSLQSITLKAKQSSTFESFYGQTEKWERAAKFRQHVQSLTGYAVAKREENHLLLQKLTDPFAVHSALSVIDGYSRQAFLDNTLRGGQPFVVSGPEGSKVFHFYTRKHGDMERDYNQFEVSPSYLSQGNGNFRDVNQNRRSETWLFPGIGEANIETFFNLIQLDGYNPLVIQFERFFVPKERLEELASSFRDEAWPEWESFLSKPFIPGDLLERLSQRDDERDSVMDLFRRVLLVSEKIQDAVHGEGFWVDHWTYNLDLLESFAALFPDRLAALLVERRTFTYYDNAYGVNPRSKRYVQRADGAIRQLHAVIKDKEKEELIRHRTELPNAMRTGRGTGSVYRTSLLAKILGLLSVKAATLDPFGLGIEMEAEKPGWCDALNGLPSLFGSSINEAFELRRWAKFLADRLEGLMDSGDHHKVPKEVAEFMKAVRDALELARLDDFYRTWDQLNTLKETFREKTKLGISGEEVGLSREDIYVFLSTLLKVLDASLPRAFKKDGSCITYFINEVAESEALPQPAGTLGPGEKAVTFVKALKFKQKPLNAFLEGPVHALRGLEDQTTIKKLYGAVKGSPLFDKKLGMYRLNVPLTEESYEIGRNKTFTPGWLENESIFLHMHYKFLLETLRSGLAEEFFKDLKTGLVAFQDPDTYGRSNLENSSFICSSAFPDARVHGEGFVARLTGATAEWISMVFHMVLGREPFRWVNGTLRFEPQPTVAGWLFSAKGDKGFPKGTFGVKLFGRTWVLLENPSGKDTFAGKGLHPAAYRLLSTDGHQQRHEGPFLPEELALPLRQGKFTRVVVELQ